MTTTTPRSVWILANFSLPSNLYNSPFAKVTAGNQPGRYPAGINQ